MRHDKARLIKEWQRSCLHFLRKSRDPKFRWECEKCGKKLKIASGMILKPTQEGWRRD